MKHDPNESIARAKACQERLAEMEELRIERDRFIVEAAERGATAYRIGKELGLTTQAIDYILKKAGNGQKG